MKGDIYVDIETITQAEDALLRLFSVTIELLHRSMSRAVKTESLLADKVRILKSTIAQLHASDNISQSKETLRVQNEERLSLLRIKCAELDRIIDQSNQLSHSIENFKRKSSHLESIIHDLRPSAKVFLSQIREDLRSYVSIPSPDCEVSKLGINQSFSSGHSHLNPPVILPINRDSQLPHKFYWLNLAQIEPTDGVSESTKVSNKELQAALQVLDKIILPTFQMFGANIGRDWFYAQDRAKGYSPHEGSEIAYTCFFGADAIAIDRRDPSLYQIVNGKHRISIARKLGWTSLPVTYTDIQQS